jgi:hypothetical protein
MLIMKTLLVLTLVSSVTYISLSSISELQAILTLEIAGNSSDLPSLYLGRGVDDGNKIERVEDCLYLKYSNEHLTAAPLIPM